MKKNRTKYNDKSDKKMRPGEHLIHLGVPSSPARPSLWGYFPVNRAALWSKDVMTQRPQKRWEQEQHLPAWSTKGSCSKVVSQSDALPDVIVVQRIWWKWLAMLPTFYCQYCPYHPGNITLHWWVSTLLERQYLECWWWCCRWSPRRPTPCHPPREEGHLVNPRQHWRKWRGDREGQKALSS